MSTDLEASQKTKLWSATLATAGILSVAILIGVFWPTEHKVVRRRTRQIVRCLEKSKQESYLEAAAKTARVKEFLAPRVTLSLRPGHARDLTLDEIMNFAHAARAQLNELQIRIRSSAVTFPNDVSANVSLVIQLLSTIGDETSSEILEAEVQWAKVNGKWLVSGVRLLETIRRPMIEDLVTGSGL